MRADQDIQYPGLDHCDEQLNSKIHTIGIILGVIFLPVLLIYSSSKGSWPIIASLIYGFCFIITFSFSTLFHSCRVYPRRSVLKVMDRISIYFLIAGSYTPLIANYLQNELGSIYLIILWSLAIGGVFFEIFLVKKYIFISVPFYLLMGCMFVFTANRFFSEMPQSVIILILAGVALYISGVFFYINEKLKHSHAIWHTFVLVAALCHYAAIFLTTVD